MSEADTIWEHTQEMSGKSSPALQSMESKQRYDGSNSPVPEREQDLDMRRIEDQPSPTAAADIEVEMMSEMVSEKPRAEKETITRSSSSSTNALPEYLTGLNRRLTMEELSKYFNCLFIYLIFNNYYIYDELFKRRKS